MLVIREAQIAAMQHDSDVRWYEGRLSALYPQFAGAASAQRMRWIDEGIARASAARLGRAEVFQFLCFEQTYRPGCLDAPSFDWARKLLQQADKTPAECMRALRHESVHRLLRHEAELEAAALMQSAESDNPEAAHDSAAHTDAGPQGSVR